jgi:hypothetical protein
MGTQIPGAQDSWILVSGHGRALLDSWSVSGRSPILPVDFKCVQVRKGGLEPLYPVKSAANIGRFGVGPMIGKRYPPRSPSEKWVPVVLSHYCVAALPPANLSPLLFVVMTVVSVGGGQKIDARTTLSIQLI